MAELEAKILRWGSSVGVRIRKADAERLGLRPGQVLRFTVPEHDQPRDLSHWPKLALGAGAVAAHDEGFEEL